MIHHRCMQMIIACKVMLYHWYPIIIAFACLIVTLRSPVRILTKLPKWQVPLASCTSAAIDSNKLIDLHTRNLIACRSFSVHFFLFFSFAAADPPPADTSRSLGFESPLLTTFYGTGRIPRVFSSTAQYALLRSVPLENKILVEFLSIWNAFPDLWFQWFFSVANAWGFSIFFSFP